jgi:hypothetical protein
MAQTETRAAFEALAQPHKELIREAYKLYKVHKIDNKRNAKHVLDFTNKLNDCTVKLHIQFMQAVNGSAVHLECLKKLVEIQKLVWAVQDAIFFDLENNELLK